MGRPPVKRLCKLPQIHQDVLLGDHVCPPNGVPPRNPRRQFLVVGVSAFSTGAPAPLLLWVGTFTSWELSLRCAFSWLGCVAPGEQGLTRS